MTHRKGSYLLSLSLPRKGTNPKYGRTLTLTCSSPSSSFHFSSLLIPTQLHHSLNLPSIH